jgi:hypothetical protein
VCERHTNQQYFGDNFVSLVGLGFELSPLYLQRRHTSSPFCSGNSGDEGSQNFLVGWPGTLIFPIFASQQARITGVSYWHLAQ